MLFRFVKVSTSKKHYFGTLEDGRKAMLKANRGDDKAEMRKAPFPVIITDWSDASKRIIVKKIDE